jgi:hypothetical protein
LFWLPEACKVMDDFLQQAKFSKPHYEKAAREFVESYRAAAGSPETYMGHWVGMATHDVGTHTGPLLPGMVFTIEQVKNNDRTEKVDLHGDRTRCCHGLRSVRAQSDVRIVCISRRRFLFLQGGAGPAKSFS